jgi:hypothetical protein
MSKPIRSSSLNSILKHARRVVIAGVMTSSALFAGCAQAGQYPNPTTVAAAPATRPDAIYVYAFDSSAGDVKLDDHGIASKLKASMSGDSPAQQQSQEAVEAREAVANEIVAKLQSMGLPAIRADVPPPDDRSVLVVAKARSVRRCSSSTSRRTAYRNSSSSSTRARTAATRRASRRWRASARRRAMR